MDRPSLQANLQAVRQRMDDAARRVGRDPAAVRLVAVTKHAPDDAARALVELGVADLGENYPQELWRKAAALHDLPVRWHLIGHLQSNKARRTLPLVRMVHGTDSLRLLTLLDELAADLEDPPGTCLQVNTSGEPSKHGWSPEALIQDAPAIARHRRIPIVGLMTMAPLNGTPDDARACFARLRGLRDEFAAVSGLTLDELSMGMSNDFEIAIEEGATLIRVGTALLEGLGP